MRHTVTTANRSRSIRRSITPTSGHPLEHAFTRAIPTSQCIVCHMHQPNMFMNSFLGYTMWDYESDAPSMWPEKQQYPSDARMRRGARSQPRRRRAARQVGRRRIPRRRRRPESDPARHAVRRLSRPRLELPRGLQTRSQRQPCSTPSVLRSADDDPAKFKKAVHLSSVHVDVGMQCVDCHFSQDNHGNGHIYGEVAQAVEIGCVDCHGTVDSYPNLYHVGSGRARRRHGPDRVAYARRSQALRMDRRCAVSALDARPEARMEDEPRQEQRQIRRIPTTTRRPRARS